jgi:replication factor C subunit 1
MSHPVPFMKATSVVAPKVVAKEAPDLEEAIEEDDGEMAEAADADAQEDDDEIDLKKDKYIKQPKKKPVKKTAKKDDADDDQPKKGAKGKAASRGKAKK